MIGSVVLFFLILLAVYKLPFYRFPEINPFLLPLLLVIKVLASFGVWWYYYHKPTFGIESDLYQFYNVANQIQHQLPWLEELKVIFGLSASEATNKTLITIDYWHKLHDYGVVNDNRLMIRMNMILNWMIGNNFSSHSICFSFIGFSGSVYLLKMIRSITTKYLFIYAVILFLLPSGLIWTGSMFKETTLLFTLGGTTYFLTTIILKQRSKTAYLYFFIFAVLLLQTKPLYSLLFLYTFICFYFVSKLKFARFKRSYLLTFFLPIIMVIGITSFMNNKINDQEIRQGKGLDLPLLLKNKQEDFYYDVKVFHPETVVDLHRIDRSYGSILCAIPSALKNVFLMPILLSFQKWEMIPFGLELIVLYAFLVIALIYPKKNHWELNHLFFCLFLTSLLCLLFLGLTIPIEGLIVKYAAPVMPFIFLYTAIHVDWDKINFVKSFEARLINK